MPVVRTEPRTGRVRILDVLNGADPVAGRTIAFAMHALIILSAIAFAVSTVPDLNPGFLRLLEVFELFVVLAFFIEYSLRLYAAKARLKYALSFWGIVDLLAWAPAVFFAMSGSTTVRILRLIQVARLLKILRYSRALSRLGVAFREVREELIVFLVVAVFLLYLSSVGIYFFEHTAQPDMFSSIPASFWWAMVTLTTVGYGDIVPVTLGGRFFTTVILFLGMGVFAVPAGVIASALIGQEIEEKVSELDD